MEPRTKETYLAEAFQLLSRCRAAFRRLSLSQMGKALAALEELAKLLEFMSQHKKDRF